MTTKTLSAQDLDDRLASLAEAMAEAEQTVTDLSLPAAGGDASSIEKLAKAHAKVVALTRDRDILLRARSTAVNQADAASQAEAEAARQAAKDRAIGHAKRIFQMANRIDALAEEYRQIVAEMPQVEHQLWQALREAGCAVSDGVVGRKNLVAHATNAVTYATAGASMRPRPCAQVAGVAWNHLLGDEDI